VKASAAALATQLRDVIPAYTAKPDVTVIAHSLGGLVARHALQADDIAPRVRDVITLATPHHGTVLASLLMADARIRKKVGLFGFFCQRMSRRVWPITPGMQGMAYDNLDDLITHDVSDYGAHENRDLAHLNRSDKIAGKITRADGPRARQPLARKPQPLGPDPPLDHGPPQSHFQRSRSVSPSRERPGPSAWA